MGESDVKKHSIKQVFITQAVVSFIVIGILVVLGALLVFRVMGTEYTHFTAISFISVVYFSFIMLQPAGTLFAARVDFIKEKVAIDESEEDSPGALRNPWIQTVPAGFLAAFLCSLGIAVLVSGTGWKPSPAVITVLALLYVIPYYLITKRYITDDLVALAKAGPLSGQPVRSKSAYFWGAYIFPNLVLQFIINGALGNRGFSHEAAKLQQQMPDLVGMVPSLAVGADLAITFMFVCNFTFLATCTYVISDMYRGRYTYEGTARGIHGFLYFIIMLLMGVAVGIVYIAGTAALGIKIIPFWAAMVSKFSLVFIAVYLGARLSLGWTGKRFNEAAAEAMAASS